MDGSQRLVSAASRTKAIGAVEEVGFIDGAQHLRHRALDDLVLQDEDAERPLSAVSLGDVRPANRQRLVPAAMDTLSQSSRRLSASHSLRRFPPSSRPPRRRRLPAAAAGTLSFERLDVDVVQQRREPGLARPFGRHPGEMIWKIGPDPVFGPPVSRPGSSPVEALPPVDSLPSSPSAVLRLDPSSCRCARTMGRGVDH